MGPKPIVVYGAAKINPTGRGEISVPVKYVAKVCERHYHTVYENEYLSSKVCHMCHKRLHPVAIKVRNKLHGGYPVRGLLWCPTCKKFVNRDKNATVNIECVFRAGTDRPEAFKFGQKKVVMKKLVLLPEQLVRLKKNKLCRVSKRGTVFRKNAVGKTLRSLSPDTVSLVGVAITKS